MIYGDGYPPDMKRSRNSEKITFLITMTQLNNTLTTIAVF